MGHRSHIYRYTSIVNFSSIGSAVSEKGEGSGICLAKKQTHDHGEASNKILSQSEQYLLVQQYSKFQLNRLSCFGEGRCLRKLFSLKPSLDQEEASHKISVQQVQPFHKQTTLYNYSIALYKYYCKNRFSRISGEPVDGSGKFLA